VKRFQPTPQMGREDQAKPDALGDQAQMELSLAHKEALLKSILKKSGPMIVAYSGGVDSSLLAYYARQTLGEAARIVIAVSPSLAGEELQAARDQALKLNWNLIEIHTDEVDKAEYQRNDSMRCYFCKSTLFEALSKMAESIGVCSIAYGANVDDLKDFRPGHKAAREYNVLSPLQSAALSKDEIRQLAKLAELPSWDRPQAACLSSRFPTFQPVTIASLSQVELAEKYLHSLGYSQLRVRHHDDLARIEIDPDELPRLLASKDTFAQITAELKRLGYKYVTLDLEGYRQGSANRLG
jgi:uncharacterized protein